MTTLPDELHAPPLVLRRSSVSHLDGVLSAIAVSLTELRRWMPWAATMPTAEEERAHLVAAEVTFRNDLDWSYNIFEADTDEVVGCVGLHRRIAPDQVEIGYWIRSDRTRRGYATLATRELVSTAFVQLGNVD